MRELIKYRLCDIDFGQIVLQRNWLLDHFNRYAIPGRYMVHSDQAAVVMMAVTE